MARAKSNHTHATREHANTRSMMIPPRGSWAIRRSLDHVMPHGRRREVRAHLQSEGGMGRGRTKAGDA
eukprot:2237483-Prymnesium_polylepis.1